MWIMLLINTLLDTFQLLDTLLSTILIRLRLHLHFHHQCCCCCCCCWWRWWWRWWYFSGWDAKNSFTCVAFAMSISVFVSISIHDNVNCFRTLIATAQDGDCSWDRFWWRLRNTIPFGWQTKLAPACCSSVSIIDRCLLKARKTIPCGWLIKLGKRIFIVCPAKFFNETLPDDFFFNGKVDLSACPSSNYFDDDDDDVDCILDHFRFSKCNIIPFAWQMKVGRWPKDFLVTNKAEVLIEIGCCSPRCLFLNVIDVSVSLFFFTINDDDDDHDHDHDYDHDNKNDDGKDGFDRFCLKTRSTISCEWFI